MRKRQSKQLVIGIIIFFSLILIGNVIFIVGIKQINKSASLEEGEQYMEDLLSDKIPTEIILLYGNSEVPVKDKEDIKAIIDIMYPMVVVEEEKNERLQDSTFSMELVYKRQISTVVFTAQGLEINDKVYVPRESEMQLIFLCQKITSAEMQKYLDAKDDLLHIVDLLPEEKFEEVRYYYMGEAVPVTDLEIISQANNMFVSFYGEEVVLEEDYYGGYHLELVYQEEIVRILLQGNRINIGEDVYWIREDISPFRELIGNEAVAIYEKQQ